MTYRLLVAAICTASLTGSARGMTLGIDGTRFTLDGKPTFLLGISYYGGLGAPREFVRQDFDDMKATGWNWVRVWATWDLDGPDVSAVDSKGAAREPHMSMLIWLVEQADQRGMVVDVTLTRGEVLSTQQAHLNAVRTLATALKPFRNVYIDLGNERNIRDPRYVSFGDLRDLAQAIRAIDRDRLITASQAGDASAEEVREYVLTAGVDFISPHRPRNARSPGQTAAKTREYLRWLADLGKPAPVHYQEPFRRDFSPWQPVAKDFLDDLRGAVEGGAAGWCLHNGAPRRNYQGPTRSFNMTREHGRLFDQLDEEEMALFRQGPGAVKEAQEGQP
ncbi:MAG: hypothetical protein ACE5R4_01450 [Armatimonadota bacterium]